MQISDAWHAYGYARVSTAAQDLAPHLAQLSAAGCEKIFREKITGTTADRPQLRKLISVLAPGDVVIGHLSRLRRAFSPPANSATAASGEKGALRSIRQSRTTRLPSL